MNREAALERVTSRISSANLVRHMLATEAIMRSLARRLGEPEEAWGLAGLLHDLDYEATAGDPARHGLLAAEWLAGEDLDPAILHAIRVHVRGERVSRMDHALYAADRLTGLVVAAARSHPSKSLSAIDPAFVLQRYANRRFAPAADREGMLACTACDLSLEEFATLGVDAMKGIAVTLGL